MTPDCGGPDDLAVMEQPIEDGGGGDRVAEHLPPLANRPVAGNQRAGTFVAPRHELEAQVRGSGLERQVPEFVDDQQLGLRELQQLLLYGFFVVETRLQAPYRGRWADDQETVGYSLPMG